MIKSRTLNQSIAQLDQLSRSPEIPDRQRKAAARLSTRLSSPIRVGVFGAVPDLVDVLFEGLCVAIGDDAVTRTAAAVEVEGLVVRKHVQTATTTDFSGVDIAIWATSLFDTPEARIWSTATDRLKDHSFLVALFDPIYQPPDITCGWVDAALDDFAGFLALALDQNLVRAAPLLRELIDSARRGRQADQDSAEMLIECFQGKLLEMSTVVITAPQVQETFKVPSIKTNLWHGASDALKQRGQELLAVSLSNEKPDFSEILTICVAASDTLTDLFLADSDGNEFQKRFQDDVLLAADNIVLMSLENNEAAAIDATTTLLQLQRDIQIQLSAN